MDQAASLTIRTSHRFTSGILVAPVLDVAVSRGSILVLFGPSGAGKTTILRQIAGLDRPDRGVIRWGDQIWCDTDTGRWQPPQQRRIGVVFQEPTLFPHLTVGANVTFGIRTGSGHLSEAARLLDIADLNDRVPAQLSSGQAQRVALARALASGPQLLLMDEPFAALDAPTRLRLRRDVRALLQRTGTPAVMVTHDRTEALAIADSVAVVIGGRVRQVGATADVFSRPVDAEAAAALGIEAVLAAHVVSASDGLVTVSVGAVQLSVAEREPASQGSGVYACIRAEDVTIEFRSPAHASARNHLAARVTAIAAEGPIERVSLDCGFPLDALITRRSREELGLAPGTHVTAAIKATSIHLVPRV